MFVSLCFLSDFQMIMESCPMFTAVFRWTFAFILLFECWFWPEATKFACTKPFPPSCCTQLVRKHLVRETQYLYSHQFTFQHKGVGLALYYGVFPLYMSLFPVYLTWILGNSIWHCRDLLAFTQTRLGMSMVREIPLSSVPRTYAHRI
jgi:hypothetical protein